MNLRLLVVVAFSWIYFSAWAGSPSVIEQISLKPGDVIVSINGKKMKNNLMAIKILNEVKAPSRLVMEVLHGGKIQKTVYDLK